MISFSSIPCSRLPTVFLCRYIVLPVPQVGFLTRGIQSAVFEHVAVMLTKVGLYVFENASSRATIAEGHLGKPIPEGESIIGLPVPMIIKDS